MATINWPASIQTGPVDYGVEFDVQISVYRSGRVTTFGLPGGRWVASIRFEAELENMLRPRIEALVMSLKGGANRLSMHHHGRSIPNGSLRGAPTLGAPVVAGAESLALANCNGDLKAGDIIGVPNQFVMVLADATPVATNMTVQIAPPIRTAVNSGTALVWNRPTTLWVPRSSLAGPFPYMQNKVRPAISIDLIEAWT